jgi:hypothetical protein
MVNHTTTTITTTTFVTQNDLQIEMFDEEREPYEAYKMKYLMVRWTSLIQTLLLLLLGHLYLMWYVVWHGPKNRDQKDTCLRCIRLLTSI